MSKDIKNTAFYTCKEMVTDVATGEVLQCVEKTIAKTSPEPEFIKVYYETMMAFNSIYSIPTSFVLSLSKFLEWSNDGKPQCVTLNKRVKDIIKNDCGVGPAQVDRYIKASVNEGLLFRTEYRGVYEVNPFMIAKGKWDSIKTLRSNYNFIDGKWQRTMTLGQREEASINEQCSDS